MEMEDKIKGMNLKKKKLRKEGSIGWKNWDMRGGEKEKEGCRDGRNREKCNFI